MAVALVTVLGGGGIAFLLYFIFALGTDPSCSALHAYWFQCVEPADQREGRRSEPKLVEVPPTADFAAPAALPRVRPAGR